MSKRDLEYTPRLCNVVLQPRIYCTSMLTRSISRRGRSRCNASLKETEESSLQEPLNEASRDRKYIGKKAIVVGAGPAGSTSAAFLAQHGFTVEVYEKRNDPSVVDPSIYKTFHIGLRPPTVKVLEAAGLDLPCEGEFRNGLHNYYGMVVISDEYRDVHIKGHFALFVDGRIRKRPIATRPYISGMRHSIATAILKDVKSKNPDNIHFHFNHECRGVDLEKQTVSFAVDDEQSSRVSYDLLVSADGANSVIREALKQSESDFKVRKTNCLGSYQPFYGLDLSNVENDFAQLTEPGWVTFGRLNGKYKGRPTPTSFFLNYSESGKLNGMIAGKAKHFENIQGEEKEWFDEVKPEGCPKELTEQLIPQLIERRISKMPPITRVTRFYGPRTILIGDAGHSLPPGIGLGCNMAIADGDALNDALSSADGDLDAAPRIYNDIRYDAVQRTLDIEEYGNGWGFEPSFSSLFKSTVGFLHFAVLGFVDRFIPGLLAKNVFTRFGIGEISEKEAMAILMVWQFSMFAVVCALVALPVTLLLHVM